MVHFLLVSQVSNNAKLSQRAQGCFCLRLGLFALRLCAKSLRLQKDQGEHERIQFTYCARKFYKTQLCTVHDIPKLVLFRVQGGKFSWCTILRA